MQKGDASAMRALGEALRLCGDEELAALAEGAAVRAQAAADMKCFWRAVRTLAYSVRAQAACIHQSGEEAALRRGSHPAALFQHNAQACCCSQEQVQ